MGMDGAFDKLVEDLDDEALAGLSRAVKRAASERRTGKALQLEDIHPRMSDEARERAHLEIARVLRGEE
jgi:hypothetical protein